jgi:hypothetical protein
MAQLGQKRESGAGGALAADEDDRKRDPQSG